MNPVIMLGFSGAGKSSVVECIKGVPGYFFVPEYVVPPFIPQVYTDLMSDDRLSAAFRGGIETNIASYARSGMINSQFFRLYEALKGANGVVDFFRHLQVRGKRRLVFESSFMAFCPDLIFSVFPQSQLIYLVRDGFDCADLICRRYDILSDRELSDPSTSEMLYCRKGLDSKYFPWWVPSALEREFLSAPQFARAAWMWKAMSDKMELFLAKLQSQLTQRVLVIRYEGMIESPCEVSEKLGNFLSISRPELLARRLKKMAENRKDSIGGARRRSSAEKEWVDRIFDGKLITS